MRMLIIALALAGLNVSPASADTADLAKLTCKEIANATLEEVVVIGAWLSGYYNGKQNNTIVDARRLQANTAKVLQYCGAHPDDLVLKGIETIGAPK